eukprot:CAMPEP_0204916514 /NCGR_PEP_ID=MMETSP1397-20131031/14302_1 /ASSEMBLY_ACC=CAM_ASM_000891 /TAXON_ID=49980 /ORGANISM="Climacostomum Climacostomum virens, Strain Stock W-24" /LENGTH=128 /DNA_ID=CAMNT_0052089029 /DNA_START=32 /DNA_END=415 /DNA_ORIENTATION=-
MIRRVKTQATGPYSYREQQDIWTSTHFIVERFYGGKDITELERDYVLYIKSCMWHSGSTPFFTSFASFFLLDKIYPLSKLARPYRAVLKCLLAVGFAKYGVKRIKEDILKFPLLDPLVVTTIVRHSKW